MLDVCLFVLILLLLLLLLVFSWRASSLGSLSWSLSLCIPNKWLDEMRKRKRKSSGTCSSGGENELKLTNSTGAVCCSNLAGLTVTFAGQAGRVCVEVTKTNYNNNNNNKHDN